MRNAILHLPETRTASERRQVLRAAIRQLERAEVYLAAIAYMDLDDRQAQRAVNQLRTDVGSLRRHLSDQRLLTRS
jgi:acyl-CoA reductase-like NAD-dependent aldehyde dehydrogenase